MSKVIIIAPSDVDVKDAVKLLKGEGHDVDVEEPTGKSLLHIVLGLFSANAYGFGSGYYLGVGGGKPPKDEEEDTEDKGKADDEQAIEGEATKGDTDPDAEPDPDDEFSDAGIEAAEEGEEDVFNFESTKVDGEVIKTEMNEAEFTTLVVTDLAVGPKTVYKINEARFSFWPNNKEELFQRVLIQSGGQEMSIEVRVVEGDEEKLLVGKDTAKLFQEHCGCKGDEVGWYVTKGPNDKFVEGPMEEQKAKKRAKELGGDKEGYDTTYVSDYQLSRKND